MSFATQVFVEPSVRTWIDWTPDRIKLAERYADGGSLRLAAELCDAMLADDRVSGLLNVRAKGLLTLGLTFEPGPGRRKRTGVKYLEAQEDWDVSYPAAQLGKWNQWGILLGVSPAQNIWTKRDNGRVVPVLDPWHPKHLRYDNYNSKWLIHTANSGEVEINPGDGQWMLYTPGGSLKRPWADGAWRAVARWWLLKHYAESDWGLQGERSAGILVASSEMPPGVANGQEEVRRENRQKLVDQLRAMGRGGVQVLPPGWKLDVCASPPNSWETFREQINTANVGISIALAGQNLTSEVSGGSFAAAEVHRQIGNVLLSADATTLASCIHDQALVWWSEFNLGDRKHAPWPSWDTTPPADLTANATTLKTVGDAAVVWKGLLEAQALKAAMIDPTAPVMDIDFGELARQYGMPLVERKRN